MPIDEAVDWVPESCSLPTVEQPLRVAEFDQLFGSSLLRYVRASRTQLDAVLSGDAETTARHLAEREARCCSFFRFEFDQGGSHVLMRVEVPQSRIDVLDALAQRMGTIVGRTGGAR
jgi:hypothetical protein